MTPISVNHYSRTAALRQKIEALGGRAAVQARDVFDLHTLAADGVEESLVTTTPERATDPKKRGMSCVCRPRP